MYQDHDAPSNPCDDTAIRIRSMVEDGEFMAFVDDQVNARLADGPDDFELLAEFCERVAAEVTEPKPVTA